MSGLDFLPWDYITQAGAVGVLIWLFWMTMTGRMGTPGHMKDLRARITYLETVIMTQSEAVTLSQQNAAKVQQVGSVVEHTMGAISEKAGHSP